jgi:NitT/TauT family transport system substrate-binding protein
VPIKRLPFAVLIYFCLLLNHSSAPAAENIRVAYPSMNSSTYCLIIAQKEGYMREEGLNVELLSIRGEIAIRIALAGEIDFFTNAGSALAAAVRGVPVKILAVFQDKPSWDLIAQPNIKSMAQLRGTNVAIMSPEGSLAVVAREILKQNGLDPVKDLNLVVMGGDEVRFPAMKAKAIQATLFNTGTSIKAQKEGFTKLASAGDFANLVQGGLATSDEKIKQNPGKLFKFIRASLKGINFFVSKREPAIKYMMDALRLTDREMAIAIYDIESKLILRQGFSDDKILQTIVDDMKRTTKVQREIKTGDIFDLSFVRKANDELKASGWKP